MLMIMTLALLVYAIAEKRLRNSLKILDEKVPNQIDLPIQKPTLRLIFQLLDGVSRVKLSIDGKILYQWVGLTELRVKILRLFGDTVQRMYQILEAVPVEG